MTIKNIERWMLLLVVVLLTACHSNDDSADGDCYLDIYVYAPDRPIVTRGDVGEITPTDAAEKQVNSLQIWVFKNSDGTKVGYLSATPTILNETTGQEMFRMQVDKAFADAPENVDVYVVANTSSCGLTFTEATTRANLDAAVIGTDYFGTTSLVSTVPAGGLPMSAVLKNQPIQGRFPSLRIGTEAEMSVVQLTRAVSKLRFVLCQRSTDSDRVLKSINNISLNANQIPVSSWLIPREVNNYTYNHEAISYGSVAKSAIPAVADPMVYLYETQSAQDYEDMINTAISQGHLLQTGLTYLRESDLQLTGTIQYTYTENSIDTHVSTDFSMAAPGDFLRNHSWIVYIFYMGTKIHVQVVTHIGMRGWDANGYEKDVSFYNW